MNLNRAVEATADSLESSENFLTVGIVTPLDGRASVVLAKDVHGVTWMVTVERLAGS